MKTEDVVVILSIHRLYFSLFYSIFRGYSTSSLIYLNIKKEIEFEAQIDR